VVYRNVGTEVRHYRDYEDRNMSKLLDVQLLTVRDTDRGIRVYGTVS